MSRLADKVAVVTGASKGIGGGIAMALAAAGARVAVNYSSDKEGAERVAQAIADNGGKAVAVGADVSKAADVTRLFSEVDAAFADITEDSFRAHYNINVLGLILTVQEAIKRFGAPEPVAGATVMVVAAIGILVNGVTASMFAGGKDDINLRGAFVHLSLIHI